MAKKKKVSKKADSPACCSTASLGLYAAGFFAVIAVLAIAYAVTMQPAATECPECNQTANNTTNYSCPGLGFTPTQNSDDVKEYVGRVMASYSDLMYSSVPEPVFDNCSGYWVAEVTLIKGMAKQIAVLEIDDETLTLNNAYLEAPVPPVISQNSVVTNGTVKLEGKISCSENNLTRVMLFSDPYCPNCILADEKVANFTDEYGDYVDFEYHVLQTTSYVMKNSFGRDDVDRMSKYYICTQDQGMLKEFQQCAILKYRTKGVEAPLTKEETDSCLPEGLDTELFESCVAAAQYDISMDSKLAETYGIIETPVVLVDCQYRMHPTYLEHGFCFLHPEIAECAE